MNRILKMWRRIRTLSPVIGFWRTLSLDLAVIYNFRRSRLKLPAVSGLRWLRIEGLPNAIALRVGTSDYIILLQIFGEQEYAPLSDLPAPSLILDCGANVGYSSLWFLRRFPKAQIIAIEPDPDNYRTAALNLEPYKDRVRLLNSAIWSHPAKLVRAPAGLTIEAAGWVKEAGDQEAFDLIGTDMRSLIESAPDATVDLLKMDIEGAESKVFEAGTEDWISKVKNIAIELHGSQCESIFFAAMRSFHYERSSSGELTICRNIRGREVETPELFAKDESN